MFTLCRIALVGFVILFGYCACLIGTMVGGGLFIIMAIAGLAWAASRRKQPSLSAFGTARWADKADVRRAGMTRGRGLSVGTLIDGERPSVLAATLGLFNPQVRSFDACNHFLAAILRGFKVPAEVVRLSASVHTAVFAPTGAGKGVSCVIPFLFDCPESCVVVDFKGDLAQATMAARRRMGHRVVLLDPYRMVTQKPDCLNPLDFIRKENPQAVDEVRDLAESLVIRTGQEKEPHWADSAESWIGAVIAGIVEYGDADDRSLQTVRDVLSDPQKMELMVKVLCQSTAWEGILSRLGCQLTHYKDKELASTLTTVNRFLRHLDTLAVMESTKASTFDPGDLLKGKMTVYLVLPPEHARTQSALLRSWISTMLRAVLRGGVQRHTRVHFMLDEASSLGRMEVLDDAVDKYRGYGVRLTFIYQSLGQLRKCFPEGQDQTLLSNVTQVFFGVNDPQTAEYISNRLGDETIVVDSGGTSRGTSTQNSPRDFNSSRGTSWNSNSNWAQQARKLLKPEEVMSLSPGTAITFAPAVPPIATRLIRYYEGRPDSLRRRFGQGLRVAALALLLLGAAALAARTVNRGYRVRLPHPPRAAVQADSFNKGDKPCNSVRSSNKWLDGLPTKSGKNLADWGCKARQSLVQHSLPATGTSPTDRGRTARARCMAWRDCTVKDSLA